MSLECVLIVEDDRGAREALAELLRADGYAVREAGNVAEARASLGAQAIDAMLLDLKCRTATDKRCSTSSPFGERYRRRSS